MGGEGGGEAGVSDREQKGKKGCASVARQPDVLDKK